MISTLLHKQEHHIEIIYSSIYNIF